MCSSAALWDPDVFVLGGPYIFIWRSAHMCAAIATLEPFGYEAYLRARLYVLRRRGQVREGVLLYLAALHLQCPSPGTVISALGGRTRIAWACVCGMLSLVWCVRVCLETVVWHKFNFVTPGISWMHLLSDFKPGNLWMHLLSDAKSGACRHIISADIREQACIKLSSCQYCT